MPRFPLPVSAAAAARGAEWLQAGLVVVNLAWTTLCLGGYRAETMVVSSVLTGALLVVHLVSRLPWRGAPDDARAPAFHPASWLPLPLLGYLAANTALVSLVPWLGWRDWLGWAQMAACFFVTLNGVRTRGPRAAVFHALVALGVVGAALAAYQRFVSPTWLMLGREQALSFVGRGSGSFGIPNSLGAFLILLLPVTGALAVRRHASPAARIWWGYLTLVLAVGLVLTISRGAWLALGVALCAWPLFAIRRAWWRRLAVAGLVLGVLTGGAYLLSSSSPRVKQRLVALWSDRGEVSRPIIWRAAWQIVRANTAFGSGGGSFATEFEAFRPVGFQDDVRWAHNEYLHLLSEYGVVGLLLAAAVPLAIGLAGARQRAAAQRRGGEDGTAATAPAAPWRRRRSGDAAGPGDDSLPRQALAVGLTAFCLQDVVDFHLKIPALAMAFAVLGAFWVQLQWPTSERLVPVTLARRLASVAAAALIGLATLALVYPIYRAEALRLAARAVADRLASGGAPVEQWIAPLVSARAQLQRAVQYDDGNAAAWADRAYVTTLLAVAEPDFAAKRGIEAEEDALRALARSAAPAEFWVRRGVAFDLQQRWAEAGTAFVRALEHAPAHREPWYYHAWHLSLYPAHRARALAAVDFCLRLDPGNPQAQALRERLAGRPDAR